MERAGYNYAKAAMNMLQAMGASPEQRCQFCTGMKKVIENGMRYGVYEQEYGPGRGNGNR